MPNMMYTLDNLTTIVTGVGQCVYDAVAATPAGAPNRYCALVPGEIAWDECDCGQLAQSISQVAPSINFPIPAGDVKWTGCTPELMSVTVNLSMTRCVPIPTDNGKSPKCNLLYASALTLEADRYVVFQALTCCLNDYYKTYAIAGYSIGVSNTVGPEGACAGFNQTYTIGFTRACCE